MVKTFTDNSTLFDSKIVKIFAQTVSIIFHPVFIPLYCTLIFFNSLPFAALYSAMYKIFVIATILVFTCIIPFLYILFKYITGSIPDFYIANREKRTSVYIISLISYVACVFCLVRLRAEPFFLTVFISSVIGFLLIVLINLKWKISVHSCGAGVFCGAVFAFAYYLNAAPLMLFCAVILIAGTITSARLMLKVHTLWQVIAGFFVGLIFSLFPLIIL